jgi:hypothetical protein
MWWRVLDPERAELVLANTSVGSLADDNRSWPQAGKLVLDGFVYGRFSGTGVSWRVNDRLSWLARQKEFAPQPFRQLAKVLASEGDHAGTLKTLSEMEQRRRKIKDLSIWQRVVSLILKVTIGYGYYPFRALGWLATVVLVGAILYWIGFYTGRMVPTDKEAHAEFVTHGYLPPQYVRFHALIYSLENSFPLVKLGQVDFWQPDPDSNSVVRSNTSVPYQEKTFLVLPGCCVGSAGDRF